MSLPKSNRGGGGEFTPKKRLNFLRLTPGQHIIRFLQPINEVLLKHTHWIKGTTIECVDVDTCPVCAINKEILASVGGEWQEAKKVKGFNPYQKRYYANVLDLTPVKVSPNSEVEFENKRDASGKWPIICEDTGDNLASIPEKPSLKVKILNGGVTLFSALDAINDSVGDEETREIQLPDGTIATVVEVSPYGIDTFDVTLMVQGTGRDRQVTPIPQAHRRDEYDLEELGLELYELDRALLTLEPEEVKELLRGISVRDILSARNQESEGDTSLGVSDKVEEGLEEQLDETQSSLEDLFNLD